MQNYDIYKRAVEARIKPGRFQHTLRVEREAVKLAALYGADIEKCRIAAILHDMAKNYSDEELLEASRVNGIEIDFIQLHSPQLLHGHLAAALSRKEFAIEDEEILNAIKYHTTGRGDMSLVEKIVFLADFIEEGRDFKGLKEIRETAYDNLDKALLMSCNSTIEFVIKRNILIHPLTIEFRNNLILKGGA